MRLFVAVWPSREVADALAALPRPDDPAVRWTTPDQWHVTLRFLGEVPEDRLVDLVAALGTLGAACPPALARVGPATTRLGRSLLVAPVAGVDDLAASVVEATRGVGAPPPEGPFTGHLTLARGRGRRPVPASLAGASLGGSWPVTELALVRSELRAEGARYDDLAVVALTA